MGMMGNYYGSWDQVPDYMKQMMQSYYGGIAPFGGIFGLLQLITWILVLVLLVAAIRYLWIKGSR